MVSISGPAGTPHLASVSRIATFLSIPEAAVTELLEEGRLDGALLALMRRRGAAITPKVKNSVQMLVRTLERKHRDSGSRFEDTLTLQQDSTTAIMFTDVVKSTNMMHRLGDRAGRIVLGAHDEIMRSQSSAHDGIEVKSMGDGFMFAFRSTRSALACAIAIQKAFAEHNEQPSQVPIDVRIGVSVGEPIQEDKDLFGMSVIMAARIVSKAKGGQVIVSEIAHALASSSGDFEFQPLGPFELQGIDGRHELFEVVWRSQR